MAKLTTDMTYVEKQVTIMKRVPVKEYTLKLSIEELFALHCLIRNVAGDPDNSPRKYIDNINREIWNELDIYPRFYTSQLFDGGIGFRKGMVAFDEQIKNIQDSNALK